MHAGEGSTGVEVRAMRPGDANAVHSLMTVSLDEYFAPEMPMYFLQQWPRGSFVAVDFLGNVVGYIGGALLSGGRASVSRLCVSSGHRGRGIGSLLLSHLMMSARLEGLRSVQLEVKAGNLSAIRFYESRGFTVTESLPSFYNDGSDGLRMVAVGQGKVIAAGKLGKWKTTFQMVTIVVILLFNKACFATWYTGILTGISVALTLWSAVDYFVRNKSVFATK